MLGLIPEVVGGTLTAIVTAYYLAGSMLRIVGDIAPVFVAPIRGSPTGI